MQGDHEELKAELAVLVRTVAQHDACKLVKVEGGRAPREMARVWRRRIVAIGHLLEQPDP